MSLWKSRPVDKLRKIYLPCGIINISDMGGTFVCHRWFNCFFISLPHRFDCISEMSSDMGKAVGIDQSFLFTGEFMVLFQNIRHTNFLEPAGHHGSLLPESRHNDLLVLVTGALSSGCRLAGNNVQQTILPSWTWSVLKDFKTILHPVDGSIFCLMVHDIKFICRKFLTHTNRPRFIVSV